LIGLVVDDQHRHFVEAAFDPAEVGYEILQDLWVLLRDNEPGVAGVEIHRLEKSSLRLPALELKSREATLETFVVALMVTQAGDVRVAVV
jgi:hypothetical protein